MSPEQVVSKRDIDGRVDVYALGVVLYECITGRVPFDADSLPALSVKIFEGRYMPASALAPQVPEGLDDVLALALAREPSRRFATMHELCAALQALPGDAGASRAESRAAPGSEAPPPALAERTLRSDPDAPPHASTTASAPLRVEAVSDAPVGAASPGHRGGARPSLGKPALVGALGALVLLALATAWAGRRAPVSDETHAATSSDAPPVESVRAADAERLELPAADATRSVATPVPMVSGLPATAKGRVSTSPSSAPSPSKSRAATDGLTERNPFAE
jgi:serine/threonine-protein kinase